MTEDYLQYIWKFSKFDQTNLQTVDGESVHIIKKGNHNSNAGPDFLEGQLRIGETLWAGSVEIHVKTSLWSQHNHQNDERYNNVVLHVVYEHDKAIFNQHGELIPTLELKDRIDENAYFYYEQFLNTGKKLPCENRLKEVPPYLVSNTIDAALYERLERKSSEITQSLEFNKGDWEETFHQFLFKYLGMKVNSEQMMELSKRVPLRILKKESQSLLSSEALIIGQAGLLEQELNSTYHQELRNEYLYLKQKYGLVPMKAVVWKFSRMRPANFPTLRMAQLAAVYVATKQLFYMIRDKMSNKDIALVLNVEPSSFWQNHYSFKSEKNKSTSGKIGELAMNSLIINCIVPFSFSYGQCTGDESYQNYALELLERTKPEQNVITKRFRTLGFENRNAKDSQALIQLNNQYCSMKKCLNCKIGVYLLQ